MYYRTRTYIAGDWDHDKDAVKHYTDGMIVPNTAFHFQTLMS